MQRATDTKNKITSAAKELFIGQGYRGTSTKQIAEKAGVSEMTFFRHFPTKESAFREVASPLVAFIDELQVDPDQDVKELIRQLLQERLLFLREERDLVRLVLTESYLTSQSLNPILETAKKIRGMLSKLDSSRGDLQLRLIMGFILTCIFLPDECDTFPDQLDQLIDLIE